MPSMRASLTSLVLIGALFPAFSQEPQRASIRVTVKTEAGPVAGAVVFMNEIPATTDQNGLATATLPLGKVEVSVSKDGFFPAKASLSVDEAREWQITVDLKPQEKTEEEVTVFATRTDTKVQDSPTRVEVISQEEIRKSQ